MFRFAKHALTLLRSRKLDLRSTNYCFVSIGANLSVTDLPVPVSPLRITLRKYQEECIQAVLSHLAKGSKRLGISLATGAGKTVIFTHLIDRIPTTENASRTLILAHRRELVEQAARHCTNAYPDKSVDIEMGNHNASGIADITVASIQSITSGNRLYKFDPSKYKLILVDEAHHIVSPTYLTALEHFGLKAATDWETANVPALVGVSATFTRFDGRKLGTIIDHIVYHRDYIDMIEDNWLSDVMFTTVQIDANLNKVGTGAGGDFQTSALSKIVNTDGTNDVVIQSWLSKAKNRKSTLVFCVDISHVASLTDRFRQFGVHAEYVTGETANKVRSNRIERFRKGEFPVLINCGVFTEGTDIPNIDCVLLTRPTKSRNLLVQMIGRGMRLFPGKTNCHIIDFVSALSTGVVSTPTLFGLDSAEVLEQVDHRSMLDRKDRKEKEQMLTAEMAEKPVRPVSSTLPGTIRFTDYDSVHDLIEDASDDRIIRKISNFAWVAIGDSKYVLTTSSGNYLAIEPKTKVEEGEQEAFQVKYYWRLPPSAKAKSLYSAPKVIAESNDFEHIVHAADTFAAETFEYMFISKNQAWRRNQASQAQVDFLNKFRPEEDHLKVEDLTKGKAGDMITRIKHGTKGRFLKAQAKQKSVVRKQGRLKDLQKKLQGTVQVGPLTDAALP